MEKKELRDRTYWVHRKQICLFPTAKQNQRELISGLHGKFREGKHRVKSKWLHKNKQINWGVDKLLLKSEGSCLLKQSNTRTAFTMGVAEARKHLLVFILTLIKFKEGTIWHSAFNSRKRLSDAKGSL